MIAAAVAALVASAADHGPMRGFAVLLVLVAGAAGVGASMRAGTERSHVDVVLNVAAVAAVVAIAASMVSIGRTERVGPVFGPRGGPKVTRFFEPPPAP